MTVEERDISMGSIRLEYIAMRAEHSGFSDVYAAEFDRALAAVIAKAKSDALNEAADAIRVEAGADEMALVDVTYEAALPESSRVMLNGVTRACERLRARAKAVQK